MGSLGRGEPGGKIVAETVSLYPPVGAESATDSLRGGVAMSVSAELLTQLLNLPEAERTGLAHHLLLSLEAVPFDPDSQAAWEEELHRRLDKIEKGQFQAK